MYARKRNRRIARKNNFAPTKSKQFYIFKDLNKNKIIQTKNKK
jgi:hypothetical protein